jgi:ribulose-phosphate 3-epimerase
MVEIIPAILTKSFKELERQAGIAHAFAKKVQIDVVDGVFAKHATWPYKDGANFQKIKEEEHGLPFWEDFDFEFDLMIENPHEHAMDYVRAGASHIIIHAHATGAVEGLRKLAELRGSDDGAFSVTTGLALLPNMQPDVLESFDTLFDYVQVMGIDNIGRQGEPFDEHAVILVERLRRRYPDLTLQVDGGVNMETVKALAQAGANRLVVGSAIFGADNPEEAYKALYTEANGVHS